MGTLFVVGTPIGNLEDLTLRAIRTLKEVDLVAAEDTRQTVKLLNHLAIQKPLTSYHEHNQRTAGPALIERLQRGESIALVTDAGMPAISDPGEDLVRLALEAGIPVVPVPGPTAFATALVISGLPTGHFVFQGFLPARKKDRREALERLRAETRTVILYEAPHRILDTLEELSRVLGDRPVAAARELTKIHEEVRRGTTADLLRHFEEHNPRGEFVLVIGGAEPEAEAPAEDATPQSLAAAVQALEAAGSDRKTAMKQVADRFGLTKRDVYQALLELKADE